MAMSKAMATRVSQKQLAYLAYWQHPDNGAHEFPRGAVIPEEISIKPASWALPSRTVLAVTAVMLVAVGVILWFNQ
jgi:hypothetical protein